jgi:2-methylthioadenine synthetase
VDGWYGKFNYKKLLKDLEGEAFKVCEGYRHITTPSHYTYIKISEGCDRHCAYCAIPLITGKHQSRPMEEILEEVRYLVRLGVKEFNVIAQELTYYGVDIDGKQHIAELIEKMADIEGGGVDSSALCLSDAFPLGLASGDTGETECLQLSRHCPSAYLRPYVG